MGLQQKNDTDLINVCFMFNIISIKDSEDVTIILLSILLEIAKELLSNL